MCKNTLAIPCEVLKIITFYEIPKKNLNKETRLHGKAKNLIIGSLLGDSCVEKNGRFRL